MPAADTSATKSLGRVAYERLHELIETGVLRPGDRISVNSLADKLGISRTPVREAIAWLETDGLVVHQPYLGRVVGSLDRQMVSELYATRMVLETTAAAMAAQNASDTEMDVLQDLLALEAAAMADPMKRERLNRRFHEAIYSSAHNRYLLTSLRALQSPMVLLGPATAADPARVKSAYAEHQALVQAIVKRDVEGAREAMRRHLAGGLRTHIHHMLAREA